MANEEHLAILKRGVDPWNRWREARRDLMPDLRWGDLRWADLRGAYLSGASLIWADLRGANLSGAYLSGADLRRADLRWALLHGAVLRGANLIWAHLRGTHLTGAYLGGANLIEADLSGADLSGADLTKAIVGGTSFADVDLSAVEGLDTVIHMAPSSIGIDTVCRSKGDIPGAFLRGTGVPESFIAHIGSLVGQVLPFYSCFISHSSRDQAFAERLHADLRGKGVRCWFTPEDMSIRDEVLPSLHRALGQHDKLLLVLSKHSVGSHWAQYEVEAALDQEHEQNRRVLFPIRLDDVVMEIETGWPAIVRHTRDIGDFRQWNDGDAYQRALSRLLRDLEAEES
jgi:hypothetical protein